MLSSTVLWFQMSSLSCAEPNSGDREELERAEIWYKNVFSNHVITLAASSTCLYDIINGREDEEQVFWKSKIFVSPFLYQRKSIFCLQRRRGGLRRRMMVWDKMILKWSHRKFNVHFLMLIRLFNSNILLRVVARSSMLNMITFLFSCITVFNFGSSLQYPRNHHVLSRRLKTTKCVTW